MAAMATAAILARNELEFILTDEEVRRASQLFSVEEPTLAALNARGLLNTQFMRDSMAVNDFISLTKGLADLSARGLCYTLPEVKRAICSKYHLTLPRLSSVIKSRTTATLHACRECGRVITAQQSKRTGGICADCASARLMREFTGNGAEDSSTNQNIKSFNYEKQKDYCDEP